MKNKSAKTDKDHAKNGSKLPKHGKIRSMASLLTSNRNSPLDDHQDRTIPLLIGALFVAVLPQVFNLHPWILSWCLILWGYMILVSMKKAPKPDRIVFGILIVVGFIGVLATSGRTFGGGTYISLLAVMAGLKPLEIDSHRDRMVTVFLCYFLVITSLFDYESLAMILYLFLSVLITTGVLIHVNYPAGRLKSKLRLSGMLMAKSLPLVIILFLLFPRIQGGFFGMTMRRAGKSGFTENMRPGDISRLAMDDEIAFRVHFDQQVPDRNLLYWRGIVMWHFDGRGWTRGIPPFSRKRNIVGSDAATYQVTLLPHGYRWLYALDIPVAAPQNAMVLNDNTLYTHRSVRRKMRYQVTSYTDYNTGDSGRWERIALRLPSYGNPRARTLAEQWRKEYGDTEDVIRAALSFFRDNGFTYTLNPPPLGDNTVDDFLFTSRKGFCGHYASAMAYLMRSAGIPARVVGGYLGGELNPYGNYLIVRQSDAHAWIEVYLQGKGWKRIDPTAVVAPDRITAGVDAALSSETASRFLPGLSSSLKLWKLRWDALNDQWDSWFMSYSHLEQTAILSKLGFRPGSIKSAAVILFSILTGLLILILPVFMIVSRRNAPKTDPALTAYIRFCNKLSRLGLTRQPGQGPLDFAGEAGSKRPDLDPSIREITNLYIQQRYGPSPSPENTRQLIDKVKRFRPDHR